MNDDPDSKQGMLISAVVAVLGVIGCLWFTGATSFLMALCAIGSVVMLYKSAVKNRG
jgi:type IV secretory pathway VirB2 component (pilin)